MDMFKILSPIKLNHSDWEVVAERPLQIIIASKIFELRSVDLITIYVHHVNHGGLVTAIGFRTDGPVIQHQRRIGEDDMCLLEVVNALVSDLID